MRISAIWYPVSRWPEARQFYAGVLGLTETHCDDEAGSVAFATEGGPPLFLVRRPERAGIPGGVVVTLDCPDLPALRDRLLQSGARIDEKAQEGEGVRILTFYDPDGNCLEASQATGKASMASQAAALTVRPVQASDAAEWLRMRMALWPGSDPDTEAGEIAHFLAVPPLPPLPMLHGVFVCPRSDTGLCGLMEVSIRDAAPGCKTDHIGYLEAWYVDPDCRGQGIGRLLAQAAEAWARSKGCVEMASDTTPSYPVSPAAHAALGYHEVERYFRKDLA
jgi:aminoglycoside 6'-N-acetyltransferase I